MIPLAHILTPIENFLTDVLEWLHTSIGLTWAWAIVVLVALVRIVILPLTIKQIRSMQRLQMYAPQLKALQQKYKHDKQRMNEEVMKFYKEHKVNPAASCLPIVPQIPIFFALFYVLRDIDEEVIIPFYPDSTISFLQRRRPGHLRQTSTSIGRVDAARHLRGQPAPVLLPLDDCSPVEEPALHLHGAAVPVHPVRHQLPGRAHDLLGDHEPLDRGPGPRHAASLPATDSRDAEAYEPNAASRRRRRRRRGEVEGAEALAADDSGEGTAIGERHRPAARAATQEEGLQGEAMSETDVDQPGTGDPDREAEAAGETVGEAKWTALRELERRFPGLDKGKVEFVVLSEGERGLLGVGFVPARVIARIGGELPVAASLPAEPEDEGDAELSEAGTRLKQYLELVRDALEIEASVSIRETAETLVGTFHGRELGLAIGKRGQTIDAIQQLAGAILYRVDEPRLDVAVDAAGYRDRRRTAVESLADRTATRVATTGQAADLEPMSPAERKIVHIRLKDRGDVVTESSGVEPNRYVVIRPAE